MTGAEVLRLVIDGEPDVFAVRQRGREVAKALGFDSQDQIRVATALSDLGRDLVRASLTAVVTFALQATPVPALVIEVSPRGAPGPATLGQGLRTASRMMDLVQTRRPGEGHDVIVLVKHRSPALPSLTPAALDSLREDLGARRPAGALDELRAQNQELIDTLESLEARRQELQRLNEELAETNRGVVALYKELSEELEETNRGVVALYAELNEKSSQIKTASEAKTRFWSNISHELRTPINSVVGLAKLLLARGSDPLTEEQQRQVRLIGDSGVMLLALVNELLDTAKAESGRLVAQPSPVDLTAVFLQLRGTLRSAVPSDEVALVIDELPAGIPLVVTDETMLLRILRNLLSNGLKFTDSGEVRLRIERDADREFLRFVVADTGIGIPADQQDRVFEEFHQVRNELQARAGGTGLGLPYARRLAEILGGDLTLRSELGQGTTVTLRLPVREPGYAALSEIGVVLLVDDDENFRQRLAAAVESIAGKVVEVSTGREALDAVTETRPGLIFLDLFMPVMNGREVLAVLREKPELAVIPVVVVSSTAPEGLDLTKAGLGAALLLKSQISAESIRLAVREAFAAVPRRAPK